MDPVALYVNWTAYDELSDGVELDETLAMQQFDELLRLRSRGVRLDGYVMDAFWYDPDEGYRTWRQPHWPAGPERWLAACRRHGVVPGLWVSTNSLCHLHPYPAWEDSLNGDGSALCMFEGGFLADFVGILQHWADRGIRVFKFDFARFDAATAAAQRAHAPTEILTLNHAALRTTLAAFRRRNPGVQLLAYNGFGGIQDNTSKPFRPTVDLRLLDVFDSLYCGDPCPADVPLMNFWRAVDVYSDHMVRQYERNGVPLERIDNSAFMIGRTAACYRRQLAAWRGMLLLSLARGGRVNTYYGNLELLADEQAAWFARAQALFLDLQRNGRFRTLGGIPGAGQPYGYEAASDSGALYTLVNPSQAFQTLPLGLAADSPQSAPGGRILFADAGYRPELAASRVALGPEQMCVVGVGAYDDDAYQLGVEPDVTIPSAIEPLPATFETVEPNAIRGRVAAPRTGDLRIVMTQRRDGIAHRSKSAGPASGRPLSEQLRIRVRQAEREIPVRIQHDKVLWSGLSWAVGEVEHASIRADGPLEVLCASAEAGPLDLDARVYAVSYAPGGRRE